jgi:hypothetical protein
VSSHILLSLGRSFANEIAGAGPISFAVNSTRVPSPREIVLVFGGEGTELGGAMFWWGMEEGDGTGFGGAMLWWGMVVEESGMLRSDGRIDSEAAI